MSLPHELIGKVAVAHLRSRIEQEPNSTLRFCMVGMDKTTVCHIALAVFEDSGLTATTMVKIPKTIADDTIVPEALVSEEAAAHWRHCIVPEDVKALLFAIPNDELQRIGKTAETLPRLQSDQLRSLYRLWVEGADADGRLQDKEKERLETVLRAINETHSANTIETFSAFVLRVYNELAAGKALESAIDAALPALRLPSGSGDFATISQNKRDDYGEWARRLRKLNAEGRPLLIRENPNGESIAEQLAENYQELAQELDDSSRGVIERFLSADLSPDEWSEAQADIVELPRDITRQLFAGVVTVSKPQTLGELTVRFFENEFPDQLLDDETTYLRGEVSPPPRRPSQPYLDEAIEFFEAHRDQLIEDSGLFSQWEKLLFSTPETYCDFLVALVETTYRLRSRAETQGDLFRLTLTIPGAQRRSFWEGKHPSIVRYFLTRYRGLDQLFGGLVEFDYGRLQEFYEDATRDDLAELLGNDPRAKEARRIKFQANLVLLDESVAECGFFWEFPLDALPTSLPNELERLLVAGTDQALLVRSRISRQTVGAKGTISCIDLNDANTIRDVEDSNAGILISPNRQGRDIREEFEEALEEFVSRKIITKTVSVELNSVLSAFTADYTKAIRAWVTPGDEGIACPYFIAQAERYEELLSALNRLADNDQSREQLWSAILSIGVAYVDGGKVAAIVTPWHPLRLAEIYVKASQVKSLLRDILTAADDDIRGSDLFFEQRCRELSTTYYPQVCLGIEETSATILAESLLFADYSLLEKPTRTSVLEEDDPSSDADPRNAAKAFAKVCEEYLCLLPHERSNFSVVLYNAESKGLPNAVAQALSQKVEQENDLRCDLLLSHDDPVRTRRIYEQQNAAVGDDEDSSALSSDAAMSFLSRLRVGFLDNETTVSTADSRATDIVLLQDVIARSAEVAWLPVPVEGHPSILNHVPTRWSLRRPISRGHTSTAVYLAAPLQPSMGQTFLDTLHKAVDRSATGAKHFLPCRIVHFSDRNVGDVFRRTHDLGEWVVNYDELADKRLLANNDIKVIRHIHDRRSNRNVVVSTRSPPKLLYRLIMQRLEMLNPDYDVDTRKHLADILIESANDLSGHILMRAARYGRYANELIGVVLSMLCMKSSMHSNEQHIGWYFLDDYAQLFGQKEEQIADLLALGLGTDDQGKPVVELIVSEAKFVAKEGYLVHAKKSARQLLSTIDRVTTALDPDSHRLDRSMWLSRLGDLILEGIEPFESVVDGGWSLQEWSRQVRDDAVPIAIRGFTHVYVHEDLSAGQRGAKLLQHRHANCLQEIFDRNDVVRMLNEFRDKQAVVSSTDANEVKALRSLSSDREISRIDDENIQSEQVTFDSNSQSDVAPSKQHEPRLGNTDEAPPNQLENNSVSTEDQDGIDSITDSPSSPVASSIKAACRAWDYVPFQDWFQAVPYDSDTSEKASDWLKQTVRQLQRALRGYDLNAELSNLARLTPNAGVIFFKGHDTLTVSKVAQKRIELQTSHALKILDVQPGLGEVVVYVARPSRAVLSLAKMYGSRLLGEEPCFNANLLIGAREDNGTQFYLNISGSLSGQPEHAPHTLIAGGTGSGKSILVQNMLLDIALTNSPNLAHIYLIDPKHGLDYFWVDRLPHLQGKIVTERDEAEVMLTGLVEEMERRYQLMAKVGANKLSSYNDKVSDNDYLPMIWLVHDEFAEWMMIDEYKDAVQTSVSRLGVKARAAGIHLIFVAQRPDNLVFPMQLRTNLGNRLILKVADSGTSKIALGQDGAERLLGKGHIIARLENEPDIIYGQVPFLAPEQYVECAEIISKLYRISS